MLLPANHRIPCRLSILILYFSRDRIPYDQPLIHRHSVRPGHHRQRPLRSDAQKHHHRLGVAVFCNSKIKNSYRLVSRKLFFAFERSKKLSKKSNDYQLITPFFSTETNPDSGRSSLRVKAGTTRIMVIRRKYGPGICQGRLVEQKSTHRSCVVLKGLPNLCFGQVFPFAFGQWDGESPTRSGSGGILFF